MMERLNIQHNSPEWLAFRMTGIGGSDAAAILGLSPFKTNIEVWEEKVGLRVPTDISDDPAVKYGKDAEDPLFQLFALDYPQYKCTQDKSTVYQQGFMFASLDGELEEIESGTQGFYEGKTTQLYKRSDLSKWDGKIPMYYFVQLLHYFVVTGKTFAVLKTQIKLPSTDDNIETLCRHYRFERSDVLQDLKYLYLQEKNFWGYVERRERPPLILPTLDRN